MKSPKEVVISLFVATDQQDWATVEQVFNTTVNLDYSSMNGNPASLLKPSEIIEAWKGILPGFEATHHQIGNVQVSEKEKLASVFCYGTASHYLKDKAGNLWLVVGTYDFDLLKHPSEDWKIASMKFNFKYQDGNLTLPQKAMQNSPK